MRSGNPVLRQNTFEQTNSYAQGDTAMTIQGVVNKTLLLLFFVIAGATVTWNNPAPMLPFVLPIALGALAIAFITVFKKRWAAITAPLYAVLEGLLVGLISTIFEKMYPGIVIQAVGLTFGTMFSLLVAYKSGLIRASATFKRGVIAATGGIALVYIVNIVLSFFGRSFPFIHEGSVFGILFSVFVVIVASLNLVLDFDFIETGAQQGAPRYLEWYAAFGLVVTLIWLYMEILRLLSKMRRR
ncbi:MAG: Bax inhibitor-1/YccA family protein [Candidatus Omnitrophota bacterium]